MSRRPKISVVMPNYNNAGFIGLSIESILNQTLSDFELIIIDDASTDKSGPVIQGYLNDKRMRLITMKKNIGNYNARNIGMSVARSGVIAVMDSDDIADKERLEIQYDYIKKNKLAILGSQGYQIDVNGNLIGKLDKPLDCQTLRVYLLKSNYFIHSSLCIDRNALKAANLLEYESRLSVAADYKFIVNCSYQFAIQNIPERLIYYRKHKNQISSTRMECQIASARMTRRFQLEKLNVFLRPDDLNIYHALMEGCVRSKQELNRSLGIFELILEKNRKANFYSQQLLFDFFQTIINSAYRKI